MSTAIAPVVWSGLGYQFEGASMIAGLCACLVVRVYVSSNGRSTPRGSHVVEIAVTILAMLFTAGWIIFQRPMPFYALLGGTGFNALGAGIIAMAVEWLKRFVPVAVRDETSGATKTAVANLAPKSSEAPRLRETGCPE